MSNCMTRRDIPTHEIHAERMEEPGWGDLSNREMLETSLLELKSWTEKDLDLPQLPSAEKRTTFYNFFSSAIRDVYNKYESHKTTTWSFVRNIPWMLCTAVLPVFSALAAHMLVEEGTSATEISWLTAGLIAAAWIVVKIYSERVQSKNAKETWVRHSVCFHRLHLELSRFLLSERGEKDYRIFYNSTFAILHQNLDQFALNLSPQGFAERTQIDAAEDNDEK